MKTIGVVTAGRSDYGIYLPILRLIDQNPELDLKIYATGMHLSPEFGNTIQNILADGFDVCEGVEMLIASDTPAAVAKSIGIGVMGFSQVYAKSQPDILLILGDRFEMYAAALAAIPFNIPIAHIHGGELTQGAMDDVLRHSLTKFSHLHFTATDEYAQRIKQLGEDPQRIFVTGAPSLDNLKAVQLMSRDEIEDKYGLDVRESPLLITFHPVTLELDKSEWYINELLAALSEWEIPLVFTASNADAGGRVINQHIKDFIRTRNNAFYVENLGLRGYFSMMSIAQAMVGNSSSGIIEAASFRLPVVNIGTRQNGRSKGANIIDVGYGQSEILAGIEIVCSNAFREKISTLVNPYGKGNAAELIVKQLLHSPPPRELVNKVFNDMTWTSSTD